MARLDLETRTEKLAGQLHAADLWLEASTDSVRDIQQVLELGRSLGAEVDPASLEEALETLAGIRGQLQEAEQSVDEIRGFATAVGGESDENRVARVLKLLARVVVTITEIGPRLDRLAARISDTRAERAAGQGENELLHPLDGDRVYRDPRLDRGRSTRPVRLGPQSLASSRARRHHPNRRCRRMRYSSSALSKPTLVSIGT